MVGVLLRLFMWVFFFFFFFFVNCISLLFNCKLKDRMCKSIISQRTRVIDIVKYVTNAK